MTSSLVATPTTPTTAQPGVFELLPPRAAVLDRLAEVLPAVGTAPATLVLVGLHRRDDGRPLAPEALAEVTRVVASGLRGDDWLARSGPTEFAVLGTGPVTGAQALAGRLVELVGAAAVRGTWANAGLAALAEDASASEVLRRATLCLSTARAMGAGRVITYGGTR